MTNEVSLHKIRKHVHRSGRFPGTGCDSPVNLSEQLMTMFYDILLLDAAICMREIYDKCRQWLRSLGRCIPGWADIGSRKVSPRRQAQQIRPHSMS